MSTLYPLYRTPADIDMRYFKHNYQHAGTMADDIVSNPTKGNPKLVGQPVQTWYWYDQYLNNPYWVANEMNHGMKKQRYMANASLKYEILDWLDVTGRVRIDNATNDYSDKKKCFY